MAGLLRALAGGLKGIGDGMVEKAKQDREDKLLALARSQKVEDRDAGFAQQNQITDKTEAGATLRTGMSNDTSILTTGMNNDTSRDNTASNNATSITTTGMNNATSTANTGATIAGENSRQDKSLAHDDNVVDRVVPQQDGTQVVLKKGGAANTLKDEGGNTVLGDASLTPSQNRLLAVYKAKNIMRDSDGNAIMDAGNRPQYDWAAIDTQLRGAGQAKVADALSGTAPQPKNELFIAPNATGPGATGLGAQNGGGLTSNLFGGQPAAQPPPPPSPPPPSGAVDMLRKNPALRDAFDQKYGQGAAARALVQ